MNIFAAMAGVPPSQALERKFMQDTTVNPQWLQDEGRVLYPYRIRSDPQALALRLIDPSWPWNYDQLTAEKGILALEIKALGLSKADQEDLLRCRALFEERLQQARIEEALRAMRDNKI